MRHLSSPFEVATFLRRSLLSLATLGAITLLSACAIWPNALNPWADPEPEQSASAPAPTPAPMPAAQSAPAAPAPAPEAQTSAVASPVVPSADIASAPPAEPVKAPPAAAPVFIEKATAGAAAMPSKTPTVLVPGYYINVGLFAVPANGTKVYNKLEAAGLPVFSDPVKKKTATVTRVRVGPFTTQAKATAAAKKIRSLKLDAVIFKH